MNRSFPFSFSFFSDLSAIAFQEPRLAAKCPMSNVSTTTPLSKR
jgi:hypothetical protein